MKETKNVASEEEEWRILERKIKAFHEHVKGFQKEVEQKLHQSR